MKPWGGTAQKKKNAASKLVLEIRNATIPPYMPLLNLRKSTASNILYCTQSQVSNASYKATII